MILDRIRKLYPELTKSQKLLADCIALSYREVAFLTSSELAARLDVNESTVIRFAQRLGYAGYPELIDDIQRVVREEVHVQSAELEQRAEENPFFAHFSKEIEGLQRIISHVTVGRAELLLNKLGQAGRIFVVGQGISAPLATLASLSLQSIGLPAAHYPADPPGLALMLGRVDAETVVLAIAVSSSSPQLARALAQAKHKGAWTLALGCSAISACSQLADVSIHGPANELLPLPSVAVAAVLIDAIVQTLATTQSDAVRRWQDDMRRAESLIERPI